MSTVPPPRKDIAASDDADRCRRFGGEGVEATLTTPAEVSVALLPEEEQVDEWTDAYAGQLITTPDVPSRSGAG